MRRLAKKHVPPHCNQTCTNNTRCATYMHRVAHVRSWAQIETTQSRCSPAPMHVQRHAYTAHASLARSMTTNNDKHEAVDRTQTARDTHDVFGRMCQQRAHSNLAEEGSNECKRQSFDHKAPAQHHDRTAGIMIAITAVVEAGSR